MPGFRKISGFDPFFTVIVPTYNRAGYLKKAICSVLSQAYSDLELIIVDDGSTDDTKSVVESFNDSRVRYIFQQNTERSAARNNGIDHAKGKYICFLDSDDYYLPDHLSVFYNEISKQNEPVAMFVSGVYEESESGRKERILFDKAYNENPLLYYWQNTILTPISVCIHRDILKENKFIPEFNIWEDTHLFLRILTQYSFFYVDKHTAVSVKHDESGVVRDMAVVKLKKVKNYISAINHLFRNYPFIWQHLNLKMKSGYIDKKYNMFIYQARINRQFKVTLQLIFTALKNRFTWNNLLLLLKLPLQIFVKKV
jgi:glycosyltransferase involved in cell wall biosynthesis